MLERGIEFSGTDERFFMKRHVPTSGLEEFVDCIYINRSEYNEFRENCYPTVNQELFLNFGDQFEVFTHEIQKNKKRNWLSGAQKNMGSVVSSGRHFTAGVIFKPWGLYHGFGINAKSIFNKQVDSESFFDFSNEKINYEISPNNLFELIENILLRSLKNIKLTVTMKNIINDFGREDLPTLSIKLKRSKKSIIESFNKIIGVSPYKYYHLMSVCEAISIIKSKPDLKLTDLAYDLGFYDQSHFIRIFKEHTGYSPKNFKSEFLKKP